MSARRFLSTVSPILATVHRGNIFEERSMKVLQDHLSMSLRRVGGKSDGGIDLMGWWRRLRVLAQCKAEKKKASPNYVREMEGVLHRYMSLTDTSSSSSSQYPSRRAPGSSPVPFFLLHIPPLPHPHPDATEDVDEEPNKIGTAVWNPALAGVHGLLQGKMEARWERSLTGAGRPGLWWGGKRLRSWTPDNSSEEQLTMENEDRFFEALAEEKVV
ncbi:hypothetical protein B0H11DRAFT_2164585 [Mycena galericulata]|nr:hypothetical protein B0H11DRAFT_2164585 [Mycena galericulata]